MNWNGVVAVTLFVINMAKLICPFRFIFWGKRPIIMQDLTKGIKEKRTCRASVVRRALHTLATEKKHWGS